MANNVANNLPNVPNPAAAPAPLAAPVAADPLITPRLTDMIAPKVSTRGLSGDKLELVTAMNEMRAAMARMSILLGAMDVILADLKVSRTGGNAEPLDALSEDVRNIGQCVTNANAYFGRMVNSLNQVNTNDFDDAQNQKFEQFKNVFVNLQTAFSALAPAPRAPAQAAPAQAVPAQAAPAQAAPAQAAPAQAAPAQAAPAQAVPAQAAPAQAAPAQAAAPQAAAPQAAPAPAIPLQNIQVPALDQRQPKAAALQKPKPIILLQNTLVPPTDQQVLKTSTTLQAHQLTEDSVELDEHEVNYFNIEPIDNSDVGYNFDFRTPIASVFNKPAKGKGGLIPVGNLISATKQVKEKLSSNSNINKTNLNSSMPNVKGDENKATIIGNPFLPVNPAIKGLDIDDAAKKAKIAREEAAED